MGLLDKPGHYNHFQGGSIYWTPQTGAHEEHGDIRVKWASLGWEKSYLGYPVSDEHDSAQLVGGLIPVIGRTSDFQNGWITWTSNNGALDVPKPDTQTFDSSNLTSSLPLGGSVHLVMRKNGDFTFSCHAHDSGFDNIDYVISAVLMTPSGIAFTFQHSGHVEGTSAGLPFGTPNREDNFITPGNNISIVNEWGDMSGAKLVASIDGKDKLVGGVTQMLSDLVAQVAAELAKAGASALVALVM